MCGDERKSGRAPRGSAQGVIETRSYLLIFLQVLAWQAQQCRVRQARAPYHSQKWDARYEILVSDNRNWGLRSRTWKLGLISLSLDLIMGYWDLFMQNLDI
jgi:hypothetical protein